MFFVELRKDADYRIDMVILMDGRISQTVRGAEVRKCFQVQGMCKP